MRGQAVEAALRQLVVERAGGLCEYCLIAEDDTVFGCHVDHIISIKHGGATEPGNLALACVFCNRHKGSDIGSVLSPAAPTTFVRFYHPRGDHWSDHFAVGEDGVTIVALSDIGAVTALVLGFNEPKRLLERELLRAVGRYPPRAAARLLGAG